LFEQTPFKEFKWDSDIEQHVKSGRLLATRVDKSTYNGRASATTVFLRMKQ
jgi:hypothetical protein